jgi:hypothetical protein
MMANNSLLPMVLFGVLSEHELLGGGNMTPILPSRIGKTTRRRKIDGSPLVYTVEDEESFLALSNRNKAFYLQKLRFDNGHEEYRICYYMIAEKPRMRGKWAFGQSAPMMTSDEMRLIFQKMQAKGWLEAMRTKP